MVAAVRLSMPLVPDPHFALNAAQRARLRTDIDRDAARELLSYFPEPLRRAVLAYLSEEDPSAAAPRHDGRPVADLPSSATDLVSGYPDLQALLERVLAPVGTADPHKRRVLDSFAAEAAVRNVAVLVAVTDESLHEGATATVIRRP